jgi:hypothetical protein
VVVLQVSVLATRDSVVVFDEIESPQAREYQGRSVRILRPAIRTPGPPAVAAMLAMILVLSGCTARLGNAGADSTTPSPGNSPLTSSLQSDPVTDETSDALGIAQDSLAERLLADGNVTFAEYERAVLAHLACMNDNGIETRGPIPARAGLVLTWNMKMPRGMPEDAAHAIEDECYRHTLEGVELVYIDSVRPDEKTQAELVQLLLDCLVESGMDLEAGLSERELVEATMDEVRTIDVASESTRACLKQFAPSVVFSD